MYIVTGGAGFIGSAFVAKLNAEGIDDILIVDNLGADEKWKNIRQLRFEDYMHKDQFLSYLRENRLQKGLKAIIHLGACSSTTEQNLNYLMENNYRYSKALCQYAIDNSIRFIYASSAATYGAGEQGYTDADEISTKLVPLNPYGYSKQLFDSWVLKNNHQGTVVGLKFFNVFGPNEDHKGEQKSVVCKAYQQIKEAGSVKLFKSYHQDYDHGKQKRDFVYVKDCAEVMYWLIQEEEVNGIFNLGSGTARTWIDLVHAIFTALGKEPEIEFIDMPDQLRNQYQYFTEADMQKLHSCCPLRPGSLEEGVRDYVVNYLEKELYLTGNSYET